MKSLLKLFSNDKGSSKEERTMTIEKAKESLIDIFTYNGSSEEGIKILNEFPSLLNEVKTTQNKTK